MNEEWWRMMMKDEWRKMKDEWWRMMISSCWGVLITDRQTNEQTFVIVESLSRLKKRTKPLYRNESKQEKIGSVVSWVYCTSWQNWIFTHSDWRFAPLTCSMDRLYSSLVCYHSCPLEGVTEFRSLVWITVNSHCTEGNQVTKMDTIKDGLI